MRILVFVANIMISYVEHEKQSRKCWIDVVCQKINIEVGVDFCGCDSMKLALLT